MVSLETLRNLGTVLAVVAFIAICLWAYSSKRRDAFAEAANLPFADEANDAPRDLASRKEMSSRREHLLSRKKHYERVLEFLDYRTDALTIVWYLLDFARQSQKLGQWTGYENRTRLTTASTNTTTRCRRGGFTCS